MPFSVRSDLATCTGYAVVDDDEPDAVLACHESEVEALRDALDRANDDDGDEPADDEDPPAPPPPAAAALATDADLVPVAVGAPTTPVEVPWRGVAVMAGARTQDGRVYTEVGVRTLPLPLGLQDAAQHAFDPDGAVVCGRIERTLQVGPVILAWGVFDESDEGRRAAELAATRFPVSVDLADLDADVTTECRATGVVWDEWAGAEVEACVDNVVMFPFARVAGLSMTPISAFEEAWIELVSAQPDLDDEAWAEQTAAAAVALNTERDAEREARLVARGHVVGGQAVPEPPIAEPAIVAAAAPAVPPLAWFHVPEPAELPDDPIARRLTVHPDGSVTGWLALWGECHIGLPACTQPPRSASGYAHFHTGAVPVDDNGRRATIAGGQIAFRTTHADERLGMRAAVAHYEHTGLVGADVVAVDGEHGIWCSGALRPTLTDVDVREFLGAAPSGDWRWQGDSLELVSILQVPTPGFQAVHAIARATGRADLDDEGRMAIAASAAAPVTRPRTLIRVGAGYEPQRAPSIDERLARLERRVASIGRRADAMWEHGGGRAAAIDGELAAITASLDAPTPPRTVHAGCTPTRCTCGT